MDDYSYTQNVGPSVADRVESASLEVDCELQALPTLTADLSGSVSGPIASLSGMTGRTFSSISLVAINERGSYDLVAGFALGDRVRVRLAPR